MISGFSNNAIKNINHTLDGFLNTILSDYDEKFPQNVQESITQRATSDTEIDIDSITGTSCTTNFDISRLIPTWVVREKNALEASGETNVISVFDFLQKYYDWLYCDAEDGAQYSLSNSLLDVIDVQKTREEFLKRIYSVYFNSFPYDDVKNNQNIVFDLQNARDFIVNIRTSLHKRKTNKEAIRYFFNRLFSISEEDIEIYFPKKDILRLNGGMFSNNQFAFISATGDYEKTNTLGSGLNISRFQDNDWFHDWSYLIFLGHTQDTKDLKDAYVQSLHPAGLRLVFGKQISDYQGPGVPDEDSRVCEYPLLKNYAPYQMGSTYPFIGNAFGFSLFGISGCSGCLGTFKTPTATLGFTGPTHVMPTWAGLNQPFFDINILSFIYMCYDSGMTSPNEFKTCENC
jgi:hypothetical protein